jgi:hypothetical protein
MRFAITAFVVVLGLAFLGTELGCATPYSGNPERLKKPRKKKKPEPTAEEEAQKEQILDDKCRTNFFAEPTSRRNQTLSRQLAKQADSLLVEADDQEGQARISSVREAIGKLKNALSADPYGPEATYKMAVAYALVGKKGCSVALLERLQELTRHASAATEAERVVNRALRDPSFELFRKDADAALGR